jgi:5-hydroxyisourate hydrolase-like protein (transthyretin family)
MERTMEIAFHARDRFQERFPDCPLSLEQALKSAVPFGRETVSTKVRFNYEYKIVFIIDKYKNTLKTVLTEELYYANTQMNAGIFACKISPKVVAPKPLTPAEQWSIRKEQERNKHDLEVQQQKNQKLIQDKALRETCLKLAADFAKEKNYVSWQNNFWEEVKTRYNITKKKQIEFFVPVYMKECRYYSEFRSI